MSIGFSVGVVRFVRVFGFWCWVTQDVPTGHILASAAWAERKTTTPHTQNTVGQVRT